MLPFAEDIRDDTHFEELCYEVLKRSGFHNLRWRGPAADGGRDIEADWYFVYPAGFTVREAWFVECKFYTESVPFAEIEPKLLAATSENRHCLLVITSSTLRNTCLDSVDTWIEKRNNSLRFRYWNGHDLFRRIAAQPDVLEQYFPKYQATLNEHLQQIASRQQLVISGVQERIERQIGALIQSAIGLLGSTPVPLPNAETAERRMRIVGHMLAAIKCLGTDEQLRPSTQRIRLAPMIQDLADEFISRGQVITLDCSTDVCVDLSYTLLFSALYELVDNAVRYGESRVRINCSAVQGRWTIEIINDCGYDLDCAATLFPRPRLRGEQAKAIHPSGSGLGCWISKELLRRTDATLRWEYTPPEWRASVTGTVGVD